MPNQYDVIVIGSGFGGSVTACRLAEAGYNVLILERGRRWQVQDYPSVSQSHLIWEERNPEKNHGWFDIRFFGPIATIAAAGVGGGSLHYANVSLNATADLFDTGWPPEITFTDLDQNFYPKVSAMLTVNKLPPNQHSNRTKLLKNAAQNAGYISKYEEVDLAVKFDPNYAYDASQVPRPEDSVQSPNAHGINQGNCVHLGVCELGCPVEARNTLALNYIPKAEASGAEVRPLHIAKNIAPTNEGYEVYFERIVNEQLQSGWITTRIVIVSGGSIGSTELLLRCRDQHHTLPSISPMLGQRWSTNANYLTFATHANFDVFPTRGPTISAAIKFLGNGNYNGSHFVIEDGGIPKILYDYRHLLQNPSGVTLPFASPLDFLYTELNKPADVPLKHLMPWFAQGRDQPTGVFKLKRKFLGLFGPKVLTLEWSPLSARRVLDDIQDMHRILANATGGSFIFQWPDALITPHPLGGCSMGQTFQDGVVDHKGEVFGYPNLFVADGSILPKPVGHNPSKTIAALSERIAQIIIAEGR